MTEKFKCYAYQDLPIEKIKKYAEQYRGIDMWALHGIDEDSFPFLIWQSEDDYQVMFWSKYDGMMAHLDEDPVRDYAFAVWLKENALPVFETFGEAERYAKEHGWPRKQRDA